ncbi:MAG: ABC transporter ATP-binding protein [Bacillota bacterium]
MKILKTYDLTKVYGTGDTSVEALKKTNLEIEEGEFVAIVGPSGSGKSTLLHLLGGLDKPTAGRVNIDGIDIYSLPDRDLSIFRRRKLGFIFQFYNLVPVLSAEENITLPLLLDNRKINKDYIEELLTMLGITDRKNHLPDALSGGQKQRVAIGRALANKPAIILADEPTGNLDTKTGNEVLDLFRLSCKKYHQTLIMITHDPLVAKKADRTIHLKDGVILNDRGQRNE